MVEIARVRTVFTGVAGSPYYSNLYWDGAEDITGAQAAVDLVDEFWSLLASVMNIGLIGQIEAEVPIIEDTTGQIVGVNTTTGGVVDPTNAGEPLPWATQGLIRLATEGFVDGRRVRGRINIPGLGEGSSDAGVPNAAIIASMQAAGEILADSSSPVLCIWCRPRAANAEATPPVAARAGSSHNVSTVSVWNQWAQLRSRRD